MASMEEGPEVLLRNVLRALSILKETLTTPEAVVQEIFNGFLTQHFGEETLLLLDSSLTPTPQQKITTLKRLWDSKDYYAQKDVEKA